MLTITKTYKNNNCTGMWVFDGSSQSIYIPFGFALALAESLTFDDNDINSNSYKLIGYIEVYYDYNSDIVLSDGIENVRIEKHEINKFKNELWDMI